MDKEEQTIVEVKSNQLQISVSEWEPQPGQDWKGATPGRLYRVELWPLPQELGRLVIQAMLDAAKQAMDDAGMETEWGPTVHENPSDPLVMPPDTTIQ